MTYPDCAFLRLLGKLLINDIKTNMHVWFFFLHTERQCNHLIFVSFANKTLIFNPSKPLFTVLWKKRGECDHSLMCRHWRHQYSNVKVILEYMATHQRAAGLHCFIYMLAVHLLFETLVLTNDTTLTFNMVNHVCPSNFKSFRIDL